MVAHPQLFVRLDWARSQEHVYKVLQESYRRADSHVFDLSLKSRRGCRFAHLQWWLVKKTEDGLTITHHSPIPVSLRDFCKMALRFIAEGCVPLPNAPMLRCSYTSRWMKPSNLPLPSLSHLSHLRNGIHRTRRTSVIIFRNRVWVVAYHCHMVRPSNIFQPRQWCVLMLMTISGFAEDGRYSMHMIPSLCGYSFEDRPTITSGDLRSTQFSIRKAINETSNAFTTWHRIKLHLSPHCSSQFQAPPPLV